MSSRVFWGFLLILTGGLFLAFNLGALPWGVWATLWRAWPVLLVLWGVSLLLRPLGWVGAVITGAVALLAAGGILFYAYTTYHHGPETGAVTLSQDLEPGVRTVAVQIDFGAGTINLDGQAPEGQLASGTLGYVLREPEVRYTASGADARLRVSMASGTWTNLPPGGRPPRWDIHLNPAPTYTLDLDTGACSTELDLSALKVAELTMDTGASDARITFGDAGLDTKARLSFGAASVVVRVPRSVGVKVSMSTGLVGSNLSQNGFAKQGGDWVSSGYAGKASRLDIRVEAGASSFNVEWYD